MKKVLLTLLLIGLLTTFWAAAPATVMAGDETWVVSPQGPLTSIEEAVNLAAEGDTIAVYGGSYDGPLVVNKRVRLVGHNWPVIDGHGRGSVVELRAPGIHFEGFRVRDSGVSLDKADAGILVVAPEIVVAHNRLEEVLFGVYLNEATHSVVRGNEIGSKALDVPRRGDGIRLWRSDYVRLEENVIAGGRDVVLYYSDGLVVRGNVISHGRYGLHLMYTDNVLIQENRLSHNSVGVFLMYSANLRLERNTIAFNRGPSGYGIGMKDTDAPTVIDNLLLDNRVGIFVDSGAARTMVSVGIYEGNVLAFNDVGIGLLPAVRGSRFVGNSFIDNGEQVSISGGGQLQGNLWTVDGRGNYWSDYAGYDANGDGIGDIPYRAERLFEEMADRNPSLRLFLLSPAIQAVDFAARALPFVRPKPKLTDEGPLMAPVMPPGLPPLSDDNTLPLGAASLGLMGLVAGLALLLQLPGQGQPAGSQPALFAAGHAPDQDGNAMIEVANLTKRFGPLTAVDDVSFQVQPGEAVALWGRNGAGKTTALHCLLGVIPYQGAIQVGGYNTAVDGKTARRLIGFVPQQLNFHDDLTVQETMQLYARLKRTTFAPIADLLARLGLAPHTAKAVGELSGGLKQRLALAVALLADPPLLILDEPTANLDVSARDDFLLLLAEQKAAGKTIIFSSHRPEEVVALADRVLVLEQGQLAADLPPARLNGQVPGWQTQLRLLVSEAELETAVATLQRSGFQANRNGSGLKVVVGPQCKGEPITLLNQAGIHVIDFETVN
jgi:nitrous oxidase accessory protein